MNYLNKFLLYFFVIVTLFSCSSEVEKLTPEKLDKEGIAVLLKKLTGEKAISLLSKDKISKQLLEEFLPITISCAEYSYHRMKIIFGIIELENIDQAFGFYSGLVSEPRMKKAHAGGEYSYKSPYVAAYKGKYAFWFYSSTHPENFFHFLTIAAKNILSKITTGNEKLSYHRKILPLENQFRDSLFYINNRNIKGLTFTNTYAAYYQAGYNRTVFYSEKFSNDDKAKAAFNNYLYRLKEQGVKLYPYSSYVKDFGNGIYWKEKDSINVIYQYHWMIFFIAEVPDKQFAGKFIRIIFKNMMKIRKEVPELQKKRE